MDFAVKGNPDNYAADVLRVLDALSMGGKITIVGSSSVRSQLYAGDYDAAEDVKDVDVAQKLKEVVKKLRTLPETFINDIKIGEVPEWNVFSPTARYEKGKVVDFNKMQSKAKVAELREKNIISPSEAKEANKMLDSVTNPISFITARKAIRFYILRWKPIDILNGYLEYRNHKFTLDDAIHSGGLIKIDAVSNIKERFTEFSMIYNIYKGKKLITQKPPNIAKSLGEDVLYYSESNPFKSIKRIFALAKHERSEKAAEFLVPILNSDLGRLYQIINDLDVLEIVLKTHPASIKKVRMQIDETKARMGNIYKLKDFLSQEHSIIGEIESLLKSPKKEVQRKLVALNDRLKVILNRDTLKMYDEIEKKVNEALVNM